jgi:hypothetical protein
MVSMTAAKLVNFLAIHVQEWHPPIQRYIAVPDSNRMRLLMILERIQCLIDDLRDNIHQIIPSSVYAIHLQISLEVRVQLVSLESGYSPLTKTVGSTADRRPKSIPDDQLRELMTLKYTDGEIAEIFGGSTKTIQRRRKGIGLLRPAFLHSTTDARLAEVIDFVPGASRMTDAHFYV